MNRPIENYLKKMFGVATDQKRLFDLIKPIEKPNKDPNEILKMFLRRK